jgi:hypothetical protein
MLNHRTVVVDSTEFQNFWTIIKSQPGILIVYYDCIVQGY